jgi:hypothetical protein
MPSMFVRSTLTVLVILLFLPLMAQTPQTTYSLSVAVNEVTLEFHASDGHGLPLNDLKLADLHILDNGLPPARVSKFQVLRDVPIRVAFLFDTSTSMAPALTHNREIALQLGRTSYGRAATKLSSPTSAASQNWFSPGLTTRRPWS